MNLIYHCDGARNGDDSRDRIAARKLGRQNLGRGESRYLALRTSLYRATN